MIFDDNTVNEWKQLFQQAVSHDRKWKRIPASDGRLAAMARVINRGDIHPHEWTNTYMALSLEERDRFDRILNSMKK